MTNILVPTDFTAASLKMAEKAVKTLNRKVNIILFHAFEMPFYYQDMVRPDKQPWHELLNDGLRQACRQLKDQYPGLINKISFLNMQGNTPALFRNLAEANEIDIIVLPAGYTYSKIHPQSQNPVSFFKKSRLPLLQEFYSRQPRTVVLNQSLQQADYAGL